MGEGAATVPLAEAPLVWLIGKTAAGKSSIVAALTGSTAAAVGEGFAPTTMGARIYPFPETNPALRFLDTRGLEDSAGHDPVESLQRGQAAASLMLVAVRADDMALEPVLALVRAARAARPALPLIVAQTRLHDLYPADAGHAQPYPFDGGPADAVRRGVPDAVGRALVAQRRLFQGLPGRPPRFVPLDLTRPGDGFTPLDYGADALWAALVEAAPGVAEALRPDDEAGLRRTVILPWATAAAAADAVPFLVVIGGIGAAGLQAAMVRAIARRYGLQADRGLWTEFVALLGARFALTYGGRFMARQILKLAPGIGSAATAAWSFGVTWALGEAAIAFCRARAAGERPDRRAVAEAYREGLARARDAWQARR